MIEWEFYRLITLALVVAGIAGCVYAVFGILARKQLSAALWKTAVVVVCVSGFGIWYFNRSIPFDSERWKSREGDRPRMVNDLLASRILNDAKQADVESLLGPPATVRNGVYVYWAGTDGVIDDMWLEIEFKESRVSQAKWVPD
jgi:hypothetical protein